MLETLWEAAASPLLRMVRRLCGMGRANPALVAAITAGFWLPARAAATLCGFVSVSEVPSSVGSCWCMLQARQGTAWPAPLSGATSVALPTKAWSHSFGVVQ